jgi:isopentenyl-diphosphate delta-isomerase
MTDDVILVDEYDNEIGTMPKMEAHLKGKLHRAFSVFIFNAEGDLLLQQRAAHKYHSGSKWTNTCCSHPRPGEDTLTSAHRRLEEEMGMRCELKYGFSFTYHAIVDQSLSENEYDHVFFGITNELPVPDPEEAMSFRYVKMDVLAGDLIRHPAEYTEWLKICFGRVMELYHKIL